MRRKPGRGTPLLNIRNVIRQSPYRITGGKTIPMLSDLPICHESDLERKAIILLAGCHDISAMSSQVSVDYFTPDGERRRYTPDLQVKVGDSLHHIEVKPLSRLLDPERRPFYAMVVQAMAAQGQQLDFLTEDQIEESPRQENADLLQRYRTHAITEEALADLKEAVQGAPATIRSLLVSRRLSASVSDIYAAISQRHFWIDWSSPLSTDSTIALPQSQAGGLTYDDVLHSGRYGVVLAQLVLGGGEEARRVLAATRSRNKRAPSPPAFGFF